MIRSVVRKFLKRVEQLYEHDRKCAALYRSVPNLVKMADEGRIKFELRPEGVFINGAYMPAKALKFQLEGPGMGQVDVTLEIWDSQLRDTGVTIEDAKVRLVVVGPDDVPAIPRRKFLVLEEVPDEQDDPQRPVEAGLAGVHDGEPVAVRPQISLPDAIILTEGRHG